MKNEKLYCISYVKGQDFSKIEAAYIEHNIKNCFIIDSEEISIFRDNAKPEFYIVKQHLDRIWREKVNRNSAEYLVTLNLESGIAIWNDYQKSKRAFHKTIKFRRIKSWNDFDELFKEYPIGTFIDESDGEKIDYVDYEEQCLHSENAEKEFGVICLANMNKLHAIISIQYPSYNPIIRYHFSEFVE